MQARVRADLAIEAEKLVKASPGTSLSDFLRAAVENEVSRRTHCRPIRELTLTDLRQELDSINQRLAERDLRDRRTLALVESIAQAVGIDAGSGS